MGFRLQRRIKIAPGLNVNVSKRGLGVSAGPRGAKASIGPRGARTSVGMPGTGVRYEKRYPKKSTTPGKPAAGKKANAPQAPPSPSVPPALQVGSIAKSLKRPDEKAFISGCQSLINGDEAGCLTNLYDALRANPECFDAYLIAAILMYKAGDTKTARSYFEKIVLSSDVKYPYIDSYLGRDTMTLVVPITGNISGTLGTDTRTAYLLLAEIYQEQGFSEHAVSLLRQAMSRGYTDNLVKISLLELLNDLERDDEIIAIAQGTENVDNTTLAMIFYLGQAMARKGYLEAAREVLKKAVSKKKDRDPELINEARYVLAMNYEQEGKKAMAVKQYQTILSEDFDFRDVKQKVDALSQGSATQ